MNQNKKKGPNAPDRHNSQQITEAGDEGLTEIYRIMEELYKMRLIEKLTRPIDKKSKESYAQVFNTTLQMLHNKLVRFRANLIEKLAHEEATKEKSMEEEITNNHSTMKKKIRQVEARYNEVFLEGSLKFYPKVREVMDLEADIEPIPITDWADDCVNRLSDTVTACC